GAAPRPVPRVPRMRAGVSVGRAVRTGTRGRPRAADRPTGHPAHRTRGTDRPHRRGRLTRGVRAGPTGTSHRPAPPARRLGPGPVRVGDVGRYRAGEQGAGSGSFRRSPNVRSAPTGTAPRSPLP